MSVCVFFSETRLNLFFHFDWREIVFCYKTNLQMADLQQQAQEQAFLGGKDPQHQQPKAVLNNKLNSKPFQALSVTHNEQIRIESEAILSTVASTSHAIFGNFALTPSSSQPKDGEPVLEQLALMRSMNTIELYQRAPGQEDAGLELICKYPMPNARCLDMKKVTIDARKSIFEPCSQIVEKSKKSDSMPADAAGVWSGVAGPNSEEDDDYFDVRTKDILVLQLPELKFLLLEFDPAVCEFGTYCLFNLDHSEELKVTGKRFPKQGLLRTISAESTSLSGFGFLADDTLFCWVQLQEVMEAAATMQSAGMKKQANKQKSKSLELIKRQSSQMWPELRDIDEPVVQGVLCSIQLNEKYMNAMPGDPTKVAIEQLVKPLEFFQLDKYGIQFIVDIQLVESRTSQTVSLLVLFKGDIDKMVGTKARYPVTRLAIFELQGAGMEPTTVEEPKLPPNQQMKYPQYSDQTQGQPGSALLKFVMTMEALPLYANRILTTASATDDYCFLVTPYSLCLVRLESNRVTEIFTSSLGVTITEKFKEDRNKMFYPEQTNTERSIIDEFASNELKLDGTAKLLSLPDHRLLVLDDKGDFTMITIRFDQAEIDVAEAVFQKIGADERLVGSSLCLTSLVSQNEDFNIFVSSHFHDATLLRLKTVKDVETIAQMEQSSEEVTKRQRLNSSDQTKKAATAFINRRKKQTTFYEALQTLETLPTISPITDASQIASIAGAVLKSPSQTEYSMDFLIASGNQVKSYLTFAAASLPLQENKLGLAQLLPAGELTVKDLRVIRIISHSDKYIIVNYAVGNALKTSAIAIQAKKLVQVREDKLAICYEQETVAFGSLETGSIVQVCPQGIRSVTVGSEASEATKEVTYGVAQETVTMGSIDEKTGTLFSMVKSNEGKSVKVQAMQGSQLEQVYERELGVIGANVSAISVSVTPKDSPNVLCIATKTSLLKVANLYLYEIHPGHLTILFKCAQVNEQIPILANVMRTRPDLHHDLASRSLTDLSVNISQATSAQQSAAVADQRIGAGADQADSLAPDVQEIKLWHPEGSPGRPVLIVLLEDQQVLLYQAQHFIGESQRYRFKLVESHVLVRPKKCFEKSDSSVVKDTCKELIHLEGKMALILHFWRPFAIVMRHGRPVCIDVGKQQNKSIASLVFFQTGFLAIDSALNSVKIVKFPARFDPRAPAVKVCEGYLLKQLTYKDKGIKKIKIFSPNVMTATGFAAPSDPTKKTGGEEQKQENAEANRQYIFLATYEHKQPPEQIGGRPADFTPQARAPSIYYTLEVLRLPRAEKWNEYSEEYLLRSCIKEQFKENQVINQLEQITLRSTQGDFRNYLTVASVRIDTTLQRRGLHAPRQDDEGFYSSTLNIFQVAPDQNRLQLCLLENYKRSITCMSSYLGGLIATMKNLKLQDLVFIMYKFDEQESRLVDEQPLPNGVINLATSIAFDGDYIIIGDAYKNLHLLKKCDEQDNKQERQESSGLINFKKVMSHKIDANVIGAYSLHKKLALREHDQARYCQNGVMSYEQIIPLTEIQKKMFTIMAASFDGYLRLYKINEVKNLEIKAQINIMDKVLSTVPLELNQLKIVENSEQQPDGSKNLMAQEQDILSGIQDRKIALVTQRNGILIASSCGELEFRAQQSLIELISRILPHRGCLTPMHAHLTPATVFPEKSTMFERTNSNSVNYSKSLHQFYFLSAAQKWSIASKIGFSVERLDQFICRQRQSYGAMGEQVPTGSSFAAHAQAQQQPLGQSATINQVKVAKPVSGGTAGAQPEPKAASE